MLPERLAKSIWLGATFCAFLLCGVWVLADPTGQPSPWAAAVMLSMTGVVMASIQWITQRADPVLRYQRTHKPLSGPRPGARLPK